MFIDYINYELSRKTNWFYCSWHILMFSPAVAENVYDIAAQKGALFSLHRVLCYCDINSRPSLALQRERWWVLENNIAVERHKPSESPDFISVFISGRTERNSNEADLSPPFGWAYSSFTTYFNPWFALCIHCVFTSFFHKKALPRLSRLALLK